MTNASTANTAEGMICHEAIDLIVRQNSQPTAAPMAVLRAQLQGIYASKSKDVPVCQLGLALLAIGLGDHTEALRLLRNLPKIAGNDEFILGNTMVALANMGQFAESQVLARDAFKRFPGVPSILRQVTSVFEDTLDFSAAAESIEHQLKVIGNDDGVKEFLVLRLALSQALSARAKELGYSSSDLLARLESAADVVHSRGRNIHWVAIRGSRAPYAALEMYVNADFDTSAVLSYEVAVALCEKFGERTAVDLLPISIRSFAGRPCIDDLHGSEGACT
jgi:hypothetical protein